MATKPVPKMDELIPLKLVFDPNARIALLESLLIEGNPHYVHPRQHPNIKAAIAMYQSGELNGSKVYIAGGKVVTLDEALKGGLPVWSEGGQYHQLIQKATYPLVPELAGHAILIECRLLTAFGGQGWLIRVPILHDTGSNVLSLFLEDLLAMGNQEAINTYQSAGFAPVGNADGAISVFPTMTVEYRFYTADNGAAWSAWMIEDAVFRPLTPGVCRLSGVAMRSYYYFGTGPNTPTLSIASTKGGMSSQLN